MSKFKILFLFISIIIAFNLFGNFVSGLNIEINDQYQPLETILIKVSGNFLQGITNDQIEFRRDHVKVPIKYGLEKFEEDYFIWAIAPENENNYSLNLMNVFTSVSGKSIEMDFQKNFSILGNKSEYTISPGVIYTDKDFTIEVISNIDNKIEIPGKYLEEHNIELRPGLNELTYSVRAIDKTSYLEIQIGKYTVPTYIIAKFKNTTIQPINKIRFKPRYIESIVYLESKGSTYPFKLISIDENNYEVFLEYDKNIFEISPKQQSYQLNGDNELEFNITYIGKNNLEVEEKIVALFGNYSIELPVYLNFTTNISKVETPYLNDPDLQEQYYSCSDISGIICTAKEVCEGRVENTREGICCIGQCQAPKKSGGLGWIGWIIITIVILGGVYVWMKYRGIKGKSQVQERIDRSRFDA